MNAPAFSICVYCGSRPGVDERFAHTAAEVGHWIGARGGQSRNEVQLQMGAFKSGMGGFLNANWKESGWHKKRGFASVGTNPFPLNRLKRLNLGLPMVSQKNRWLKNLVLVGKLYTQPLREK